MTNTVTADAAGTLAQIRELAAAGCEIIRVAVPDSGAVEALPAILAGSPIPVIADIHFDYRLALGAIAAGIHGIRINPGNIGDVDKVRLIAEKAGEAGIPIRVGANSGSLSEEMRLLPPADALVESALAQCRILEGYGFRNIKVSLKASNVPVTVAAYEKFAARCDYPLHLGITEAGTPQSGIVKSSVGIGALLLRGLGDTIRVSLTAPPLAEIAPARRILEAAGLREASPEIVSCPTCGRTRIDLIELAERVENLVQEIKQQNRRIKLKKIAVMGCVVNGPGEARDADLGVAGGNNRLALFRHGEIIGTFAEAEGYELLRQEILNHTEEL
jgi:(E)-4-hydroxy-3-methylbut-2-enyl-diphosphate synthase